MLAGCAATTTASERIATVDGTLNVINWAEYLPLETIDLFQSSTNVRQVNYREEYVDNVSGFTDIIRPQLSTGGTPDFDLIVPTQWLAGRMIDNGWVEALPLEVIPNHVNLDPRFMTSDFDRGSRFQMPWQGGITGISYNPESIGGEITSVQELFDPGLRGRVGMIGEMREAGE